MIQEFLREFGLSEKEINAYLVLLQIGANPVHNIARKAKLSRTTTYAILESLEEKKLVTFSNKNNVRYYTAKRPETILSLLDQQIRHSHIQRKKFAEILPMMRTMIQTSSNLPKVQFFEGLEGIKKIYEDTLKVGAEIKYAFSPYPNSDNENLENYFSDYVQRRVKAKITAKVIFPDTSAAKKIIKQDKKLLRESKLVPAKKFPFPSELNIYKNKVAIISLNSQNLHGVIIESDEIATTFRSIFELAWGNNFR